MKINWIVPLFLAGTPKVTSFVLPRENYNSVKSVKTTVVPKTPLPALHYDRHTSVNLKRVSSTLLQEKSGNDDNMVLPSVGVGVIAALVGYLYHKVLGISVRSIWKTFPALLVERLGSINPGIFIIGTCTFGGLLMGILTSMLSSTFMVSDFVSAMSAAPAQTLPSSRINVIALLMLSLTTSAFGFSLGPEAPMVCAGGLLGASLARAWYGREEDDVRSKEHQETLAYAGAAGALTASMGIPIAGSIFALEMTRSTTSMNRSGNRAFSPAIAASVAALALLRTFLVPSMSVGGHFDYGPVGALSGRLMMAIAIGCGIGGATLGTVFHKLVSFFKSIAWPASTTGKENSPWKRNVLVKTFIGLLVGIISFKYPQTLFWGEGSLQMAIDGQVTPFSATRHGLSNLLTSYAKVNPSLPLSSAAAGLQVGIAKLLAISLAGAGKFFGGNIFPIFFAAAPFAHGFSALLGLPAHAIPVAVMCLMVSTQASVTRTPLASALILSLTASATTELSVMLPACLVSSYLGVYLSQKLSSKSYFQYNE